MVNDEPKWHVVDRDSPAVERANSFARALVTARMDGDLADYMDLLADLKRELNVAGTVSEDDVGYVLGIVGSLALISSVVVRSVERSGMTTANGQSLLADLFDHLANAGVRL